jgi:hypothetical protein
MLVNNFHFKIHLQKKYLKCYISLWVSIIETYDMCIYKIINIF